MQRIVISVTLPMSCLPSQLGSTAFAACGDVDAELSTDLHHKIIFVVSVVLNTSFQRHLSCSLRDRSHRFSHAKHYIMLTQQIRHVTLQCLVSKQNAR